MEIVTIDDRQFEITAEYPLTAEQRLQTIADIRKQLGCNTCNSDTHSIGQDIQSLVTQCVDVIVQAPASITITNITIGSACIIGGTCPSITCPTPDCTSMTSDVAVTFLNSGDVPGDITPTLAVNLNPATGTPPGTVTVPATGTTTATFSGVTLSRGSNHVCVNY